MKKLFLFCIITLMICGLVYYANIQSSKNIADKLIRFHVVANSDIEGDQRVKLKVRDAILREIGPKLSKSKSREESLNILQSNTTRIEEISNNILKKNGKKYLAKAEIGDFNFPIKSYGDITLPEGEYKALKVVLGEGEGKNWWCVMFPPLCFIDITRGLTTEETDEELKKILDEDEIESITAFKQENIKTEVVTKQNTEGNNKNMAKGAKASVENKETPSNNPMEPTVEFKLKSVELLKDAVDRIKNMFN